MSWSLTLLNLINLGNLNYLQRIKAVLPNKPQLLAYLKKYCHFLKTNQTLMFFLRIEEVPCHNSVHKLI